MNTEGVTRTIYVTKTRKLADGTIKSYRSKMSYKVKDGVNDLRVNNHGYSKLTHEQKEEIMTKYSMGVTIKRICEDLGVSYGPVKRVIDKKKANEPAQALNVNIHPVQPQPPQLEQQPLQIEQNQQPVQQSV